MGSHFHGWIDCNGAAFSTESLEWCRTFSDFWDIRIIVSRDSKFFSVKKFRE